MPTPAPTSYQVASGQVIRAGQFNWPAWRLAMVRRTWVQIPTANLLSDLDPENDPAINPNYPGASPWHAMGNYARTMVAWNGGVVTPFGLFIRALKGGHADWGGNESELINLMAGAPEFIRIHLPTGAIGNEGVINDGNESSGNYFDGRPRSIHSYRKNIWDPVRGKVMCAVQGNCYYSGQAGPPRTMFMDIATGDWEMRGNHPGPGTSSGGAAVWDSTRQRAYWLGVNTCKLSWYDYDTDTWTLLSSGTTNLESGYQCLVYAPVLDCIVQFNPNLTDRFKVWHPDTGVRVGPGATNSYPTDVGNVGQIGAAWVASLGCICIWNNGTGTTETIHTLTPGADPFTDPWTWGTLTNDPSNAVTPTAAQGNGTYGRFDYCHALRGFYLHNAVGERPYFYAL